MPNDWLLVAGVAVGSGVNDNLTRYMPAFGNLGTPTATEAIYQVMVRDFYTWKNLYVRVITNTITDVAGAVFRSRVATATNGNQVVTYGSDETGVKEDTSNTDSLADGALIEYQVVTATEAGTNTVTFTIISSLLAHSGQINIQGSNGNAPSLTVDAYLLIAGRPLSNTTEDNNEVMIRQAATWSRLYTYVTSNTGTGSTVITDRKNNAAGGQSVSYATTEVGAKEDTSNSTSYAAGDTADFFVDITGTVTIAPELVTCETSGGGLRFITNSATGIAVANYYPLNGPTTTQATEANVGVKSRGTQTFKNLYVRVGANAQDNNTAIAFREDASSTISVTYAAAETGVKEETSTTASPTSTELLNYAVLPTGAGNITASLISIEQVGDARVVKDIIGVGVVPFAR